MILSLSASEILENRVQRDYPDGIETWISKIFTPNSDSPIGPHALLAEKGPNGVVSPHFHVKNQFQLFLSGQCLFGNKQLIPLVVHYANGYTAYGPIVANDKGIVFYSLRNQLDKGAQYLPESLSSLKKAPRRYLVSETLSLAESKFLKTLSHPQLEVIFPIVEDGLAAWVMRLPPNSKVFGPPPDKGGGQYIIVVSGNLVDANKELPKTSCLYVFKDHGPAMLHAGPEGAEVVIMQFPKDEAYEGPL